MAGLIPQGFIDDLLERVDLVDVINSRVRLKKTGKNYSACCPFHNENTPSFSVSPDKQFYHCFGCGASGNAIKFLMEYDNSNFPEAVDQLAASVGLSVPKEEASAAEITQQQQQKPLYQLMEKASIFYQQMLRQHPQRNEAVDYLKSRGLSGKAAAFFAIGYAPPGWDNLLKALANEQPELTKQLISCGLLIERDDGHCYDRFRQRIMFPIRDIRGRTIAFGGRVLTDEKPKYLNSPETLIFHKGQELYGLFEARKIRQKLTRFLVVEGYMDVVALADNGIHYAVATLGTATSEHHLRRLFKMVPEVVFCFDGDQAGRTAAARAMEIVLPILSDGLQVRFLFLPDGEDPDSLIRQEGKEAFEQRLNSATDLPEFLFEHLKQQVDFDTLQGKARLDQLAAPLITRIPQGTLRSLMEKQLEHEIGTRSNALQQTQPTTPAAPPNVAPEPAHSTYNYAPTLAAPENTLTPLVEKALLCLVHAPQLADQLEIPDIVAETAAEHRLLELLSILQETPQNSSVSLLIRCTPLPYINELKALADKPMSVAPTRGDLTTVLDFLSARKLQSELDQLEQRFQSGAKLNENERLRLRELRQKLHLIHRNRSKTF